MKVDGTVHLLWTGGWDSTFRLLQLVLQEKQPVQPYYIIDVHRPSTEMELQAIGEIKRRLMEQFPMARKLLLSTKYYGRDDIEENDKITKSYQSLRGKYQVGSQYDWLARFAHQERIENLEMSIAHKDGRVFNALENAVVRCQTGVGECSSIDPKFDGSDVFVVFRNMRFPLLEISKTEMARISKEAGFFNLMELSWFCHRPRSHGTPCGICNPCKCAIEEGLAWRLPWTSRIRYNLKRISPLHLRIYFALQNAVKRTPGVYSFARRIKRRTCPPKVSGGGKRV